MHRLYAMKLVGAALSAVLLAGCSGGATTGTGRQVHITLSEYRIEADATSFKPGEKVQLVLENKGREDHEFESDAGNLDEVKVPAGTTRTVSWTAPAKEGAYSFECDMPGHDGMEIELTVAP